MAVGSTQHFADAQSPPQPHLVQAEFTYEITGQEGRLFWGSVWSDPEEKEQITMVLTRDDATLMAAGDDGYTRLTIISENEMEACYVESAVNQDRSTLAGCALLERQNP